MRPPFSPDPIVAVMKGTTLSLRVIGLRSQCFRPTALCSTNPVLLKSIPGGKHVTIPSSPTPRTSFYFGHSSPPPTSPQSITSRRCTSTAATDTTPLERTALHDLHVSHGATMVPFAGYSMPVQYSDLSVGESHKWTREKASLFDVGHM